MKDNNIKKMPVHCPSCNQTLRANKFICGNCKTSVEGDYELSTLTKLYAEDQEFVIEFLKASGSLKIMAKNYGISYPTVRNKLDAVIEKIHEIEKKGEERL